MADIELRPGRTEPLHRVSVAPPDLTADAHGLHEANAWMFGENAAAIALYASVGMSATNRTHVFEKPVRPA